MCNFVIPRLLFALLTLTITTACISTHFCTYSTEIPSHSELSKLIMKIKFYRFFWPIVFPSSRLFTDADTVHWRLLILDWQWQLVSNFAVKTVRLRRWNSGLVAVGARWRLGAHHCCKGITNLNGRHTAENWRFIILPQFTLLDRAITVCYIIHKGVSLPLPKTRQCALKGHVF